MNKVLEGLAFLARRGSRAVLEVTIAPDGSVRYEVTAYDRAAELKYGYVTAVDSASKAKHYGDLPEEKVAKAVAEIARVMP